jgi:hypothetical protein
MFREPRPGGKRKREKERADPVKSQMPDRGGAAPLKPGTGGQIGATGGTLLTQYVLKNQARDNRPWPAPPQREHAAAGMLRLADAKAARVGLRPCSFCCAQQTHSKYRVREAHRPR